MKPYPESVMMILLFACATYSSDVGEPEDTAGAHADDIDTGEAETEPPTPESDGNWTAEACTPNFDVPTPDWTVAIPFETEPRPLTVYLYATTGDWSAPEFTFWDEQGVLVRALGTNTTDCVAWIWTGAQSR